MDDFNIPMTDVKPVGSVNVSPARYALGPDSLAKVYEDLSISEPPVREIFGSSDSFEDDDRTVQKDVSGLAIKSGVEDTQPDNFHEIVQRVVERSE